ncbi:MAG: hypothetical protein IT336_04355 [Thermomicrobiales bacterium]|nr:hypothetical protein [Thermomicrobiales bacterium]
MVNRLLASRNLLRVVALIAFLGIVTSLIPTSASAATFEDGYYENGHFGFSVSYDDDVWVGSELDPVDDNEGLGLDNEISWANIRGVVREDMDEEACLEYMAESFNGGEEMRDFRRAPRSIEKPESEIGGESGLYSLEMGQEDPVEFYLYLHCVAIADDQAALMIMITAPVGAYGDALPTWNDLLAGIEIGEASIGDEPVRDDAETDEESAGGSYVAEEVGLTITWDESVWVGVEFDDETGYGMEFDTELSFGYVSPTEAADASPQDCVEVIASNLEESESFKRVRKAPADMERIEGSPDGYFELYTMLSTDSPDKLALYAECRPTADPDQLLVIYISAPAGDYEDERDAWQELVDGIEISDEASSSSRENDRDERDDEAGSFVGENHDFAFEYDAELWTAEIETEDGYDWVGLTSDYGTVVLLATESDIDLDGCIDTLLEDEQEYAESDIEPAPRSYDMPETARDAEGALYTYEANEDGGSGDVVVYFDCRYIEEGESIVAVTFISSPALYEDALPKFEAILETIEIG